MNNVTIRYEAYIFVDPGLVAEVKSRRWKRKWLAPIEKEGYGKGINNYSQGTSMKTDSNAYFRLKFSLLHFGRSAYELTDGQRFLVGEKAESEKRLHQLILRQPEAAQVFLDDEIVEQALQLIIHRYPDRDEFIKDLDSNDLDEEGYRHALRDELIVETILELVGRSAETISDEEVRKHYQKHQSEFVQPERRTVRQILITVNEGGPRENQRQTSYRRLASIRKRLLNDVSTFGVEAAAHSECPSALNKGLLGTLPQGKLFPQFDKVLFGLTVNELSDILETKLGFHLLLCEDIEPARTLAWSEIEPRIREQLQAEREQRHVVKWLTRIDS